MRHLAQSIVKSWLPNVTGLRETLHNLGKNLCQAFILGHCAGVGTPFSEEIVRGAMLARVKVLSSAYTGSRGVVVEKLVDMLNLNITPTVPSQGSVGAAGDLAPMSYIARTLCGYDGQQYADFYTVNSN